MPTTPRSPRRTDALTKERIVEAAIEILDTEGESALTFRALAARLSTGSGALYWHVANKDELLAAAAADVVGTALAGGDPDASPRAAVRALALGVFDAIDAHPWVGTQLSREPWQSAVLQIFEGFGGRMAALGVPEEARFDSASALVSYVLGLAAQYAAAARLVPKDADRAAFLGDIASGWLRLDPTTYPFLHTVAPLLPEHDDRRQFLAGVDVFLNGIATVS
ncbi:TetR/AcrR family transcriptional regulator [Streptomyces sp. NPDC087440]|uniref:TetR/AcrR family transcriptional regulator n=1 Tax=Streptomyces sp. NPDC087440 TaxID=3365790 RepID=UPI0038046940